MSLFHHYAVFSSHLHYSRRESYLKCHFQMVSFIDLCGQSRWFCFLQARPLLDAENVQELVDPRLAGAFDSEELHRVVLAATLCVRQSSVWRPCMSQVLSLLVDGELEADLPDAVDFLARKSSECGGDSSRFGDNYSSDNYSSDMHRHRALALEF